MTAPTRRRRLYGLVWCLLVLAISVVGRVLVPGLGQLWVLIAIVLLLPASIWWAKRRG
jgi:Flp pilus assembly protein TadB